MFSGTPRYVGVEEPGSKPGRKKVLPKVLVSGGKDAGGDKRRHFMSPGLVGQGQEKGPCSTPGDVEGPLDHPDLGAKGRGTGRMWRKLRTPQGTVLLLALVLVLSLALVVAVAVLAAGRQGGCPAPVLACPEDWVGYRGVCYYFSRPYTKEGSWDWSLEQCSSLGASLAVLQRDWELEFLNRLRGRFDSWLGLRRRDGRLVWVDGSSFNQTVQVLGKEQCVFLNEGILISASCHQPRPFICSKPQIPPK